jgi:hypothetical protein
MEEYYTRFDKDVNFSQVETILNLLVVYWLAKWADAAEQRQVNIILYLKISYSTS